MDRQTKDRRRNGQADERQKSPVTPSIEDVPQSLATENAFNLLFLTKQRKTSDRFLILLGLSFTEHKLSLNFEGASTEWVAAK